MITLKHTHYTLSALLCCILANLAWVNSPTALGFPLPVQPNFGINVSSNNSFRKLRRLDSSSKDKPHLIVTLSSQSSPSDNANEKIAGVNWHVYQQYNDTQKKRGIKMFISGRPENIASDTKVQIRDETFLFLRDVILRTNGKLDCTWSNVPPVTVVIAVEDKSYTYVGLPTRSTNYTRFYQRLLNAQYVADVSLRNEIKQITEPCGPDHCYLHDYIDRNLAQTRFWSKSASSSGYRNKIEVISREDASGISYLTTISIQKNGQTNLTWHPSLISPCVTIIIENRNGNYTAELDVRSSWKTFYQKAVEAQKAPDAALLGMATQETRKVNEHTYYCFFLREEFRGNFYVQDQLWSRSPMGSKYGRRADVITRKEKNQLFYLHHIHLNYNERVTLIWKQKAVLPVNIYLFSKNDYSSAELNQSESWVEFYNRVILSDTTAIVDRSLRSMVTVVTKNVKGKIYYLFRSLDGLAARYQFWTVSPGAADNNSVGYLITRTIGNETVYLKTVTHLVPGKAQRIWVKYPISSTEFRYFHSQDNDSGELHPTSDDVLTYVDLTDVVTPPPRGRNQDKNGDQNGTNESKSSDRSATESSGSPDSGVSKNLTLLARISALRLWVAPEQYSDPKLDLPKYAATDKFKSVLRLTDIQQEALVSQLLPQLNGLPNSEYTDAVESLINMDVTDRKEWCGKSISKDEAVASSQSCVGNCLEFVLDATVLFVKNVQPQYPSCKFGGSFQVSLMWRLPLLGLVLFFVK